VSSWEEIVLCCMSSRDVLGLQGEPETLDKLRF
jgi:hypothetical protein